LLPEEKTGSVSASICKVILCFGEENCYNNLGKIEGPPDEPTTHAMIEAKVGIRTEELKKDGEVIVDKYCLEEQCFKGDKIILLPICLTDENENDICFLSEELGFKEAWTSYETIIWLNETGYLSYMPLDVVTEEGLQASLSSALICYGYGTTDCYSGTNYLPFSSEEKEGIKCIGDICFSASRFLTHETIICLGDFCFLG